MKKKVVLEIANMQGIYGIENFVMNTIREFDHDRYRVDFVSRNEGPFDDEIRSFGGNIYRLPPIRNLKSRYEAMLNLFKVHPEIETVHIHGNTATGCLDACAAKRAGIKRIIVHSHSDGCGSIRGILLHYFFRILIINCSTKRLCCSDAAGKWMFGKNATYEVVPNAINIDKYVYDEALRKKMRVLYGVENKKIIGHVGRIEKPKNHTFLVEVFKELTILNPDAMLLLIGAGSMEQEIENVIRKLNLQENVIWIRGTDEVYKYLQMMDILVFPSLWEGLGISLVEAQASGLPCVVSDNIKNEVCVTDLIVKLSLKQNAKEWANFVQQILDNNVNRSNENNIEALNRTGYDSRQMSNQMLNYYFEK